MCSFNVALHRATSGLDLDKYFASFHQATIRKPRCWQCYEAVPQYSININKLIDTQHATPAENFNLRTVGVILVGFSIQHPTKPYAALVMGYLFWTETTHDVCLRVENRPVILHFSWGGVVGWGELGAG